MAKPLLAAKSKVRPALDPGAPWAANGAKQAVTSNGDRAVVYCLCVEGLPLLKIGRTTHLKKRLGQLRGDLGRELHIAYWSEFSRKDSKAVERCALMRIRRHFDSEGEWSLADPQYGAEAIRMAADFLIIRPNYVAGSPHDEDVEDEFAELRENSVSCKRRAVNFVDRDYWGDPFTIKDS